MQVHRHHRKTTAADETSTNRRILVKFRCQKSDNVVPKDIEDSSSLNPSQKFFAEDFIFPQFVRPGLGHVCDYCVIKTGYSIAFTSFDKYIEHVVINHEGYSVYAFPRELERFRLGIHAELSEEDLVTYTLLK